MITEDYVSFETAKLLKEKGFDDEYTNAFYDKNSNLYFIDLLSDLSERPDNDTDIAASTLYVAMKWLRDVHNKNIILDMVPLDDDCYILWTFNVLSNKNYKIVWGTKQPKYNTYEEACEAAIKYCLENLI